ncbi:N-acetyl-gamma-glutamyl-phosphate reductase [Spirochaetia bacterium 38H-sp]|uniref:N-acetyl-gamma-glutamyl-phosphate reductase n=1 Tax=Rarispira pelagica TaxID=3141764 RepID=A0ABU9U8F1_9SPIR
MKVAVLGATGYTGMMLLRFLRLHNGVDTVIPVSSSAAGKRVSEVDRALFSSLDNKLSLTDGCYVDLDTAFSLRPDFVFSALPHLASAIACARFLEHGKVVDLSADFRLKDAAVFENVYGEEHPFPELLSDAVYGLAEWNKERIKEASLVANPGCYPTASLLPLLPLIKEGIIAANVSINALSGISGAGKSAKVSSLFAERTENMSPYLPGRSHRHLPEIAQELREVSEDADPVFTPHLVPLKQGMLVTTVAYLMRDVSDKDIADCYMDYYGESPWIRIRHPELVETRWVRGSNYCDISFKNEGDRLIIFSAIDNLIKGASGQAIENMNIMNGFPETEGLLPAFEV